MPPQELTTNERVILSKVLDHQLGLNRKSLPALLPLSFYSSELKGLQQIAKLLNNVRTNTKLSDVAGTEARYLNTLANQGLISVTTNVPVLAAASKFYLEAWDKLPADKESPFWRDEGDSIELNVIRLLVKELAATGNVSENFKQIWFNAQTFFDSIPVTEMETVLADRERLLFLFRINSAGWEIARYFRLLQAERTLFEQAFAKVLPSDEWMPAKPIEKAAAQYKDAAKTVQADVRYRISGFLNAYKILRDELKGALPRLDRQLVLRAGIADDLSEPLVTKVAAAPANAKPMSQPHQLIVTGCPGSGKSFYVDNLIRTVQCRVFRTQFHPETSPFDFIGAYKPQPIYEAHDAASPLHTGDGVVFGRGRPWIDYTYIPGPFVQALSFALANHTENVVLLIDELNRGNAAAIFGDMLQLLDRDDQGRSRYGILPTLELKAYLAFQGIPCDLLQLPANLYLWATMNSADQGVFPLDTAFRRRWNYIYMGYNEPCQYPEASAVITYGGENYVWDEFRHALNQRLVDIGTHEDKLVGPYFLTEKQLADSTSVLQKLFLYLWDDVLRFRQDQLFVAKSFSLVSAEWENGKGKPLTLTLPPPLTLEAIPAPAVAAVAMTPVAAPHEQ